MAVVGSATITWNGWSAAAQWGSQSDFTVIYEVIVDSASDGPVIVDGAPGLPRLGNVYSVGNDSDPSSFCNSKRFDRKQDLVWRVTCTYGPLDGGIPLGATQLQGRDKYGRPTDDPMAELLPFRTGQYTRSLPVTKAKNVKGWKGRPAGTIKPATNSANVIFDPPPEMDYSIMLLYITTRTLSVPDGVMPDYYNAVNEDSFELERIGFRMAFEPYSVKCNDLGATYRLRNNKTFWEFDITLAIDHVFGWRPTIVDRGFEARAEPGDPDGRGGEFTLADWRPGQPLVRALTDRDGHPLQTPILLDGDGQPLGTDLPAVYLDYIIYPELSFDNLASLLLFWE
jgi:hypothetical protein